MRKSDWAIAHHALSDALPTALIGLFACGAVLYGTVDAPRSEATAAHGPLTWPLLPLIAAAMWAGIGIFSEMKVSMAHTLARPLHRGRWLAVRATVHAAALGAVGMAVHAFSANLWATDLGPPLAFVVGLIVIAFGLGIVAGACANTETGAVGGAVVGLALTAAPVVMLVDFYGVSWPRLISALGGWLWPAALVGGASLLWPLWHVVRDLPLRRPRRIAVSVATIVAFQLLALIVIWQPAASHATSAEHGEWVAIDGVLGGPRVVYTGTDGAVDGVYVERDGRPVPVYGGGARRPEVVDARLSPDGHAIALLLRPSESDGRRIVLVDLQSGDQLSTDLAHSTIALGHWSPDSTRFAFIVPSGDLDPGRLTVASLDDATIREISRPPVWRRVIGWHGDHVVVHERRKQLELVPTTQRAATRKIGLLSQSGSSSVSTSGSGFAWLMADGPRRLPRGSQRRWTLMLQSWEPAAQPVAVDLQSWVGAKVTAFGFLDDDHVYVELTENYAARDGSRPTPPKRMLIVHRDGEVQSVVEQRRGPKLHSLTGPPQGPWIAIDVFGGSALLQPDGRTRNNSRGKNLGNRSLRWVPMRDVKDGVEFIDASGRRKSLTLTGLEESR